MQARNAKVSELSSAQFVRAMDHSPIGTALVDLDGRWIWTNIRLRQSLGYSSEEIERLTFQDITHPDELNSDLEQVEKLMAGKGDAYEMEKRYLRKDGTYVWCLLSVSIVRDADRTPDYFIAKIQDISQRKADELERATLTERLTLATRAGGVGVWEWDMSMGGMVWDSRMFQLYGLAPAAGAPDFRAYLAAVHADDRPWVRSLIDGAIDGDQTEYDLQFRIVRPDGDVRHVHSVSTVVRGTDGKATRLIGTNLDVTEMRRLVSLAEQAARSKSEFLATISHELRTPLNSIIGFSRLVLDDAPPPGEAALPPTAKRHIELVRDASTALLTIVDDVLDYSRIEAGGFELAPAPFELRPMVRNVIEIVRAGADEKGLSLSLAICPSVADDVIGDQNRLRQILLNLLGNAIKFTRAGEVAVDLSMRDGHIHWQVRDSGIGIPPEKQHLLFKRFSQVDQSIARQFGGSGLGLAICERLVSAMGGRIGVESSPETGSTFWFSTPLATASAPASTFPPLAAQPGPSLNRRILLAEDVEMNQLLAVALLERAGHDVAVVANGAEALDRVQAEPFDLVLMDVQMPVMDGIEATRLIRSLGGRFATLPIIALTANVMPDDIARFHESGMSDHIGKPIPLDAFATMIERWCPPHQPEVALPAKFAKASRRARSSAG